MTAPLTPEEIAALRDKYPADAGEPNRCTCQYGPCEGSCRYSPSAWAEYEASGDVRRLLAAYAAQAEEIARLSRSLGVANVTAERLTAQRLQVVSERDLARAEVALLKSEALDLRRRLADAGWSLTP